MTGGKRRHQVISDRNLQGTLLAHATIYWFYCLFSVTLIAVFWIIVTKRPESSSELFAQLWLNCGPALLGSVVLLPLVLLDCLRLSNRFAGPMVRMQRVLRELAAGERTEAITLRPGDYWVECAESINTVRGRLHEQNSQEKTKHTPSTAITEVTTTGAHSDENTLESATPLASPIGVPLDGQSTAQHIYSDLSF